MTRPALPHLPQFALRVAVSTALVLTGASLFGRELVDVLRPVFASVLGWVADDFLILGLNLVQVGPDSAVEARAILKDVILLGGRAIVPDGRTGFAVSTTVGTVLQPVLVATGLVIAWPGRPLEFALRLALCLLLLVPVVLSDAPLYLAASLWDMQVHAFEPTRQSALLWWMGFLVNGGRLALGLIAGAVAVTLGGEASTRLQTSMASRGGR